MRVLSIGYGRHLFDDNNNERLRLKRCASVVDRIDHIVFTDNIDGYEHQRDENLNLHPTNSPNKLKMLFDAYKIANSLLNQKGEWLISTQDPFETGLIGWLLARKYNLPLNIQEHGDVYSSKYWKKESILNTIRFYIGKFLLHKATTVRVVSDRSRKTMQKLGISENRILKLTVRSDLDEQLEDIIAENNLDNKEVTILSMARFVPQKNLIMLLRVFARLHRKHKNTKLVLVGDGKENRKIEKYIDSSNLCDAVTVVSWTSKPSSFFKKADIYALTSNYEGWARVLIESMYFGIPVVTTDVGCAGEALLDGEHGYVVPVEDKNKFYERLEALVLDDSLRSKMSQKAKNAAKAHVITIEEYANKSLNVYQDTMQIHRGETHS